MAEFFNRPWTIKEDSILKRLWPTKVTVKQIGDRLVGRTKNAVLGRATRLGLETRESLLGRNRKGPNTEKASFPKPVVREGDHPLLHLRNNQCRWPIGDPQEANFHFCGDAAMEGEPYCLNHHTISRRGVPNHGETN